LIESTADALASVAPDVKRYFAKRQGEIGLRILDAWETGIKESLGVVRGLVKGQKKARNAPRTAKSARLPAR
jgi:serine/threonine-protein kinase HipA